MDEVNAGGFPATFLDPQGSGAIVIMVAGSGPTDRDGNSVLGITASYFWKLANALAKMGIPSLRYDKRGLAGSAPADSEEYIVFDTFVSDLVRVLDWISAEHPDRPVALLGHSEGGLVALRAALRRTDIAGLVLIAAPGRPLAQVIRDQLQALPGALGAEAIAILGKLEAGQHEANVPEPLLAAFRPTVQNYLISLLALRPAELLAETKMPVAVVGGGTDFQVTAADFDALCRARHGIERHWFDTMNHVLVDASADRAENIATYRDPKRPLADGLVEIIGDFIRNLP